MRGCIDIPAQTEIQSQMRRTLEVVLGEERPVMLGVARIMREDVEAGVIYLAEQKAGEAVSALAGKDARPGSGLAFAKL